MRFSMLVCSALLAALAVGSAVIAQDDDIVDELRRRQSPKADEPRAAPAKSPAAKEREDAAIAPEGGVVLTGTRVLLPEICEGSWCPGPSTLVAGDNIEVAGAIIAWDGKQVSIKGHTKHSKSSRKAQPYKPHTFKLPAEEVALPEATVRARDLARGVDVEIAGDDGHGLVVIRIEEGWRGLTWGVLSGWEFKLEKETLTVVDADLNGRLSADDRVVYGNRTIWMPWHTVTVSGRTIYHELEIANSYQLTALVAKMDDPGKDADVWNAWQEERKNQGVPPGLFSAELQRHCVSHADYCKVNKHYGHDQDPAKPGYSKEGHDAGMSCCISYAGKSGAMQRFLDSLYHRPQLIDPRHVGLQLGGNDYAFLMGYGLGPGLPTESRTLGQPQLHPAPNSKVPNGTYSQENPTHPILSETRTPGLPIIVRVPDYQPTFSNVSCKLYQVQGDLRTGKRGAEVKCHTSHRGRGAPASHPDMWSMLALTPYSVLAAGMYEADFNFTVGGASHHYTWRFIVGR